MQRPRKILLALEALLVVPVTAFLSMVVATWGAEAAGHKGGDWGFGYLLAVPGGLMLGVILSVTSIALLIKRNKVSYLSVALSSLLVCGTVFVIAVVFHWLLLL